MSTTQNRCKVALVATAAPEVPAWVAAKLTAGGANFVSHACRDAAEAAMVAGDAQVVWIFGGPTLFSEPGSLNRLAACTVLLRSGTGTDNVAVDEATKLGIVVANTPAAAAGTVADHAAALLLAVERQIPAYDRATRRGPADHFSAAPNTHLGGATLGLVGFGRIAQLVARRMSGFDMQMLAADPQADAKAAQRLGVELVELDDLCRRADFISIHCPLLPSTHHLIDQRRLALMKPSAVVVNTARGPVIDEAALVQALAAGRLAGAGLDVFEVEPLPAESPLRTMENVVLTPHAAGYSDTLYEYFWRDSVETILEVVQGRPPKWIVNRPSKPRGRW